MPHRPVSALSLLRGFIDSNPFYLISACCMLGGCLALTNSLSWMSVPIPRLLILIGTLSVLTAIYGPTPPQMQSAAQRGWSWSMQAVYEFIPKTSDQWGALAVSAAFAFLALGAAVSLRRQPPKLEQLAPPGPD